jgi:hypothetical protein
MPRMCFFFVGVPDRPSEEDVWFPLAIKHQKKKKKRESPGRLRPTRLDRTGLSASPGDLPPIPAHGVVRVLPTTCVSGKQRQRSPAPHPTA